MRVVYSQLVLIAQCVDNLSAPAVAARAIARAVRSIEREVIPIQAGMIRGEGCAVSVARTGQPIPAHGIGLRLTAVLLHPERDMLGAVLPLGIGGKHHGLSRRNRAIRRFARQLP